MEFTRYSKICAKTVLKINWSVKTPWYKCMEVARYGLWVPVWLLHVWYFASTSDAMLLHFRCALISGYPSHSDGQYENRSKSHVQPFDRYCYARKKLVNRQPKLFKLTIAKPSFPWSHNSDNFSLSAGGLLAAFCFYTETLVLQTGYYALIWLETAVTTNTVSKLNCMKS